MRPWGARRGFECTRWTWPPERVRSGINNKKFDGMEFLYPGEDGGKSVDVEISLDPKVLEVSGDGH